MEQFLRRWISAILAALILAAMAMPAAMAESYSASFNTTTKVYQKASTSSRSMSIKKGTKCTILSISGNWAKVKRSGTIAYTPVKYLTLSERIKSYANCDAKIYKKASTSSASMRIAVNTDLYIIGREGDFWRVENASGNVTAYIRMKDVSNKKVDVKVPEKEPAKQPEKEPEKQPEKTSWKDEVVMMDWYEGGSSVLDRGDYGYLYDCSTGIQIKIKRMGGTSHADIEPATAEDTAKLLKIAGGEFSWDSHSVILSSEGKYVACAINTMPHGDQTISDNNYEGQFCLHMINSRTHGTDSVNSEHQKAIKSAYNWAH